METALVLMTGKWRRTGLLLSVFYTRSHQAAAEIVLTAKGTIQRASVVQHVNVNARACTTISGLIPQLSCKQRILRQYQQKKTKQARLL